MKILYYFPEQSLPIVQWQRAHFFDELAHYGIEFDVFNPLLFDNMGMAGEELIKQARRTKYDLFFTNVCSEKHISVSAIDEIRKSGIPTFSYRGDNLVMPYNDINLASHFDLVWLTSKETQHLYDKWGAKTYFAPYAANPFVFRFVQPNSLIRHVCFIGTPYGSRTRMMNSLLVNNINLTLFYGKAESQNNSKHDVIPIHQQLPSDSGLCVFYNRIRHKEGRKLMWGTLVNKMVGNTSIIENEHLFREKSVDVKNICDKYSEYTLSLASTSALHTDVLKNPQKIINLRNFEIPMSGGIEICRYNPELAEYFEEGKEIVFYRDNDELVDKARYYTEKATDKEILSMKHAARQRAENEHTWMNRFKIGFDILGLKY